MSRESQELPELDPSASYNEEGYDSDVAMIVLREDRDEGSVGLSRIEWLPVGCVFMGRCLRRMYS